MNAWPRRAFALCLTAITGAHAAPACSDDASPDGGDATHLLEDCAATCDPGLSCICGVCTEACASSQECAALVLGATCVRTADAHPSCRGAGPARVCDLACVVDRDCAIVAAAPRCVSGFCRSVAWESDAPMSRDAGADVSRASSGTNDASTADVSESSTGGANASGNGGRSGGNASGGNGGARDGGGGTSSEAGAGGVANDGRAGGMAEDSGADDGSGVDAGSVTDSRWTDPGRGIGCGYSTSSNCNGRRTITCSAPPTNPECSATSGGYCCPGPCVRNWADDEGFCPGPEIMIDCAPSAPTPPRCSDYGTSITIKCCEP